MTKPETIVCEIYDAWRAQDLEWLASYLPDDFCHIIHIPTEIHSLGGMARGKAATIERLAVIADDFDFLRFDTGGLIAQEDKAAVEILSTIGIERPARPSKRQSGISGPSRTAGP